LNEKSYSASTQREVVILKRFVFGLLLFLVVVRIPMIGSTAPPDLAIFHRGYPRFFQFRSSEAYAVSGKHSYTEWNKLFAPFDGIEGKILDEEVPGRSAVLPY
jgi:hypothetical protein